MHHFTSVLQGRRRSLSAVAKEDTPSYMNARHLVGTLPHRTAGDAASTGAWAEDVA